MRDDAANAHNLIDRASAAVGRAVAWLTLLMVLVTVVVVILRYVFDAGFIWLQESVTWMHAVVFMLGAAWALQTEDHVRVDVFYRSMSARRRALVNLFGVVAFLLPLCGFLLLESWGFVSVSWSLHEASRESGGLPYPLIPLLKTCLLLMPGLLALQGISLAWRSINVLRGRH